MKVTVKKWGNSASVRIPAAIMEAAHLKLEDSVDVHEEAGRIIIEPIHPVKYELSKLVDGITSDNQHSEVDIGFPVGNELM